MVCFNQEESVAGLMSEVCPFLKEMKRRNREPLRSLVRSKYCISGYFRGYLSSRMYTVGLLRENLFSR